MKQMSMKQRMKLLEQQIAEYEKNYGPLPSQDTSKRVYDNTSRIIQADERGQKIYALVEQGASVKEIAEAHGLSQGTVYQIIEGYTTRHGLSSLKGAARETADERAEKFRSKKLQGATLEEIGEMYDLSRERVRQIIAKYEKRHDLPSSIPVSRKVKKDAKKADIEEYKTEQRFEKQKQFKRFVPIFQLDAHLVGRFLKELGGRTVLYGFDGKSQINPKRRKDGSMYPSQTEPTNIFITRNNKHLTVHSWVLQQCSVSVEEGQQCHHIDGDITNNMLENLQMLSNAEHGRITMQEQMEKGTIRLKPRINVKPATCRVQKTGSKSARELRAKQISFDFGA